MNDLNKVPLGKLVVFENGDRSLNYPKISSNDPNGIPFVSAANIVDNGIDMSKARRISPDAFSRLRCGKFKPGDILYCLRGTIGKIARVPADVYGAIAPSLAIMRAKEENILNFIYFYLRSPEGRAAVAALDNGSVQPNVSVKMLSQLPIFLPPQEELEEIVTLIKALDDKITLNQRTNEALDAIMQILFKNWFVDFGPTRAKMEGRKPYIDQKIWDLFPDRLDNKGKPEGWEIRPVADFAKVEDGKRIEKKYISNEGPIPVFGGAGIVGYTTSHNAQGFVISVGRVGAYCGQFFSHQGKAWINNNASLIRPNSDVSGEWLFIALSHIDMDTIKKGSALPFLSNRDIARMGIMWPGNIIVNALSNILVPIIKKREEHNIESITLNQTLNLLLPRFMSGEIRFVDVEKTFEENV